jgi:hypothetical protein
MVLRLFFENQVAECQIFDRHFTELQKFECLKVRMSKSSTRHKFEPSNVRITNFRMYKIFEQKTCNVQKSAICR